MISCKQCQKHLVAYMNRELSPRMRGKVARHLDQCESCYVIYLQHKRTANDLRRVMPLIGNSRPPTFDRVWAAARLDAARRTSNYYPLRYGMVMVAITVLLLVPFALGRTNQVLAEPPTQPAPLLRVTPNVTAAIDQGVAVAFEISQTPTPVKLTSTVPLDAISTP